MEFKTNLQRLLLHEVNLKILAIVEYYSPVLAVQMHLIQNLKL